MSHPAISVPSDLTLAEAHEYFVRYRFTAFPVTDDRGRALGVLSIKHLEGTPRARWAVTCAGERAARDPALLVGEQADVADLLERPAFARLGRAVVVDDAGRPVGVLSLTDIERAVRASGLGDRTSGAGRLVSR